ncbi:hypothetical protein GCM10028857_05070 [Salinarchaeum chitinilyticum]
MTAYRHAAASKASDYYQLRTLPALLGIVFSVASAFQFGGLAAPRLLWVDYTLTSIHATVISLVALVVAFMSSRTRDYEEYARWEQALIAGGPILILAHQFVPGVAGLIGTADWLSATAFLVTFGSWGSAVR